MQGNLFHAPFEFSENLLPGDGTACYCPGLLDPEEARTFEAALMQDIAWEHDQAFIYGKHYITRRKVAWYGDEPFAYTYSRTTKLALPWTEDLLTLKSRIEAVSGETFNSCLLNLYHTGEEGMAWHSDDEKTLLKNGAIASLSLGVERKFAFKHKTSGETRSLLLENGSLLIMKGEIQTHWRHRLPPTKKVNLPRINLTFRTIIA